ncbi:MAG: septal ring lytic transglycosylase RlpA family protein [Hyphomonadaceae bacterium]|nr:septal ring lytic transglycosylase RlpA family protein [Hyphomonadaceae bacterium]
MKTSVSRALCMALSGASLMALAAAGSAHADRKRAPIVYAGSGASNSAAVTQPRASAAPAMINDQRRVEFRYPDAASTVTSVPETTPAPVYDQPISFAPTRGVVSQTPVNTDPVSSPAQAPHQPIRIAAVQPQTVARTGQPLNLSKVRADRAAKISEETGPASIYTDGFDGQPTANGEIFDEAAMTAAHPSLPLPSLVQVVNQDNGREVVVRVNDRGPFDGKRILELSPRAGSVLGMSKGRTANVKVRYLGPAPVQRTDQGYASQEIENESLPPVRLPEPAPAPRVDVASYEAPTDPTPTYEAPAPISVMSVSAPTLVGNVYIQAGAFADIANAQQLTASLGRGMNVKIEEARVNGGDFFRVLIGPYQTMDAAEVQRAQLSRAGIVDGFLTRR